jgi:hydroxymethylpyrimidine/phosphomethylpyrimidine kinase
MKSRNYFRVLTIAGSDSGGGAGIQADLKTFAALGCYGMSAVTALTAQNTVTVEGIYKVPANFVVQQIDAVLNDIGVDSVKTGMLLSTKIIQAVAGRLCSGNILNVVVDPVMVAKDGTKLFNDNALRTLRTKLLPLAAIITPNIPEASLLTEQRIQNRRDMEKAGAALLSLGPKAVLIKGGHRKSLVCADCLCLTTEDGKYEVHWFESKRVNTKNSHGTGCTLSAAIAAYIAKGFGIKEAVKRSKEYIDKAIQEGSRYSLGSGHGPVYHFFK